MKRQRISADISERVKAHLADSSLALARLTENMVYEDISLFGVLVDIGLKGEKQYAQRATHIVSLCSSHFPELFIPFCSRVIRNLKNLRSEGAIRNFLKILAEVPLKFSERDKSILVNQCFYYLLSGKYPVAIHVFSMQILHNISLEIPEIGGELCRILEDKMPDASAGYKSRAARILSAKR